MLLFTKNKYSTSTKLKKQQKFIFTLISENTHIQNETSVQCAKLNCNEICPLGYAKDSDDCETCQCLKPGIYQGDILISGQTLIISILNLNLQVFVAVVYGSCRQTVANCFLIRKTFAKP